MNEASSFVSRYLSAPEYVFALHEPNDSAAILVRNRVRKQTIQRILPVEAITSEPFQDWLQQQNRAVLTFSLA